MGCDIHLYKEKQIEGMWVTADEWEAYDYGDDEKGFEVPWKKRFTERNYQLFGLLASGVRCEHPFSFEPRGLPFNLCKEIRAESEKWEGDEHGTSYLYLHELKDMLAFLETQTIRIKGMKHRDGLEKLLASISSGAPQWDLLFPYCQWSSAKEYEDFEIDVPATFYVGHSLQSIIDSFEGINGDNHRVVFFFDN